MAGRGARSRSAVLVVSGCCVLSVLSATAATGGHISSALGRGTLTVDVSESSIATLDPAVDYEQFGGELLYATCLRLLNHPDGGSASALAPEAAAALPTISDRGRTYTFRVRRGLRFEDGRAVTPGSFVRALERVLSPRITSPGAQFYSDIVGAAAVLAGRSIRPSGVVVHGNDISFRLTRPSPTFPYRIAMSFMCAEPANLPLGPLGGRLPPMAGPFYFASFDPNRTIVLERNPYYTGTRPVHLARIVVRLATDLDQSLLQTRAGEVDYDMTGIPPGAASALAHTYGVDRRRFFVHPGLVLTYLALNNSHGPLRDPTLRKAVNDAIDRSEIARLAGRYGATPTDQILVPGIPGYRDVRIFPLHADPSTARALVAGRTVSLRLYGTEGQPTSDQDEAIKAELAAAGIRVTVVSLPFDQLVQAIGNTSTPYDMVNIGWAPDFADPYDYIDPLLNGRHITPRNNVAWAQFDDPSFNHQLDIAATLTGKARARAYASLDARIMRTAAPIAPLYRSNIREFVSARVGCYSYAPALQAMSLATACIH